MRSLLIFALAYVMGSIPFGYLIVRAKEGADIRETGSGGTGATNVSRRAGKGAAIGTLVFDVLKGAFAVWLASLLVTALYPYNEWTIALAGVFAIIGHIFPVWLKFRGGKGVATGMGAFFMLVPAVVVAAVVVFLVVFALSRYVSLASIVAIGSIALSMSVLTLVDPLWLPFTAASILGAGLIIFAHRENIQRLRAGEETKFK